MTMRDILFRGKFSEKSRWSYGDLYTDHGEVYIATRDMMHGVRVHEEVIPETVGQFTGLMDKRARKIFEGDVIRAHYVNVPPERCEHIEKVVFRKGRFCGMYENGTMKTWAGLPDGTQHLPSDRSVWMDWCEVIGNIHDNPEFLKGGEA